MMTARACDGTSLTCHSSKLASIDGRGDHPDDGGSFRSGIVPAKALALQAETVARGKIEAGLPDPEPQAARNQIAYFLGRPPLGCRRPGSGLESTQNDFEGIAQIRRQQFLCQAPLDAAEGATVGSTHDPSALLLGNILMGEEPAQGHLQRLCQPSQIFNGKCRKAAFHLADVADGTTGGRGKVVKRQTLRLAQLADFAPDLPTRGRLRAQGLASHTAPP